MDHDAKWALINGSVLLVFLIAMSAVSLYNSRANKKHAEAMKSRYMLLGGQDD